MARSKQNIDLIKLLSLSNVFLLTIELRSDGQIFIYLGTTTFAFTNKFTLHAINSHTRKLVKNTSLFKLYKSNKKHLQIPEFISRVYPKRILFISNFHNNYFGRLTHTLQFHFLQIIYKHLFSTTSISLCPLVLTFHFILKRQFIRANVEILRMSTTVALYHDVT